MKRDTRTHYSKLVHMFLSAPVHRHFGQFDISIGEISVTIALRASEDLFHAGGSVHGAFSFMMLDDAAFFAAQAHVSDFLLLTSEFRVRFLRPFGAGTITATGTCTEAGKKFLYARSELKDAGGELLASGSGSFVRGPGLLRETSGYL